MAEAQQTGGKAGESARASRCAIDKMRCKRTPIRSVKQPVCKAVRLEVFQLILLRRGGYLTLLGWSKCAAAKLQSLSICARSTAIVCNIGPICSSGVSNHVTLIARY